MKLCKFLEYNDVFVLLPIFKQKTKTRTSKAHFQCKTDCIFAFEINEDSVCALCTLYSVHVCALQKSCAEARPQQLFYF